MFEISDQDRAAWNAFVNGVRPIIHDCPPPFPTRSIPRPRTSQSSTLDLHGMKIDDAHRAVRDFLEDIYAGDGRRATIITGKSGMIHQEFPHWASHWPCVRTIEMLPSGGAFRVYFRRK